MPARTRTSPPRGKTLTTRKKILRQSVDVASTDGLEGLTIGRLAGELEMSKSGLFAHFGSKEELQIATLEAAFDVFIAKVITPAAKFEEGAPRLRALCDGYLAHLEGEVFPGGCFLAQAGHEFDARPGAVRDALGSALSGWLSLLQGQAELAGAEDPARLAFELHSIGLGANTGLQLLGDRRVFGFARDAIDERLAPLESS